MALELFVTKVSELWPEYVIGQAYLLWNLDAVFLICLNIMHHPCIIGGTFKCHCTQIEKMRASNYGGLATDQSFQLICRAYVKYYYSFHLLICDY